MNRSQRRQAEMMQRIQHKKQLLDENKGIEMRLRKAEAEMRVKSVTITWAPCTQHLF